MEAHSADRSRRKSLPKGTGTAPHISLLERALTDAATGLDTKNDVDRVKASMPSRQKHTLLALITNPTLKDLLHAREPEQKKEGAKATRFKIDGKERSESF